jgi:hypothetical protein
MPPGEGALAVEGAVTPPLYRRLLRFFAIGVESESSPVMFLVVMPALALTTEELGVKISIELDRKDVFALIAVFLLMLQDSGAWRGFEAGGTLLYLIHRNNVHADAILGPIQMGAEHGA